MWPCMTRQRSDEIPEKSQKSCIEAQFELMMDTYKKVEERGGVPEMSAAQIALLAARRKRDGSLDN